MNTELIADEPGTITELPQQQRPNDLRHAMMTLPVAAQNQFLAAYKESRDNFRSWLMSQLIEGTHYGIVPGCEPKSKVIDGVTNYGVWNKKANDGKGGFDWHPETQWRPKPSLYAAGADFICDLMGVRDEYEPDAVGWQQAGSKAGQAVIKCRLVSRANGDVVWESLGAYFNSYDANNAVKMASKCAKVGAIINAYGLRDLFTQDEAPPPRNDNPASDTAAPKAAPRGKREPAKTEVSEIQLAHVTGHWKADNKDPDGNLMRQNAAFKEWAQRVCGRQFKVGTIAEWKLDDYRKCCSALSIPTAEELR